MLTIFISFIHFPDKFFTAHINSNRVKLYRASALISVQVMVPQYDLQ